MKVHKVTLLMIDFDEVGANEIASKLYSPIFWLP